ncbi:unnamed protein product [Brassica oleracea]
MTNHKNKEKGSYIQWNPEENKSLINLLLDVVALGLRDSNGTFIKFMVEKRILPTLNRFHGCKKTFQYYSNRMKILKTKYLNAAELLCFMILWKNFLYEKDKILVLLTKLMICSLKKKV